MAGADGFGRDLGYLEKFFDALEAHAGTLPSYTGARLTSFVREERARWADIRPVITGVPRAAPPEPEAAPGEPPPKAAPREPPAAVAKLPPIGPPPGPAAEAAPKPGVFTVGSLKGER